MSSNYEKRLRALGVAPPISTSSSSSTSMPSNTTEQQKKIQNDLQKQLKQQDTKSLVIGGSTRLNRFSSICNTPKFRGVNNPSKKTSRPSSDATIFDRISLLGFPTDVLCNTFLFLEPCDLQSMCSTGKPYETIPHDNYIWYKLTVQRFVTNAKQKNKDNKGTHSPPMPWATDKKTPKVTAVRNWRDEYEYLLAQKARAQKFQMAQMQGRLGRLPPIPAHKNRVVVNYFTSGVSVSNGKNKNKKNTASDTSTNQSTNSSTKYSNPALKVDDNYRQGSGAGMWSALKQLEIGEDGEDGEDGNDGNDENIEGLESTRSAGSLLSTR